MIKNLLFPLMLFFSCLLFSQIPQGYVARYNLNYKSLNNAAINSDTNDFFMHLNDGGAIPNVEDRFGNPSAAAQFLSASSYTARYYNANIPNLNNVSLSFWFKVPPDNDYIDSTNTPIVQIHGHSSNQNNRLLVMYNEVGNVIGAHFNHDGIDYSANVSTNFNDNEWHHIVMTIEKNGSYTNKFYIDGEEQPTVSTAITPPTNVTTSFLRSNIFLEVNPTTSTSRPLKGMFDEITIYKRALSDNEVSNIYTATNTAPIIYVDKNVNGGTKDGTSWANAYKDLYAAIQNAYYDQEIWIAKGTYIPTNTSFKTFPFSIAQKKLRIYGGFAGNEATLADRDMNSIHTTNRTILSGDKGGNDSNIDWTNPQSISYNTNDNMYRVLDVKISSDGVILDGVTIEGGAATATGSSDFRKGAGINLSIEGNHKFTLTNSIVRRNVSSWGAGLAMYGPGGDNTLNIDRCIFEGNLSGGASAMYVIANNGGVSTTINATLTNSLFRKNLLDYSVTDLGSIAWFRAYSQNSNVITKIVNNTFAGNTISQGSASSDYPVLGISYDRGNACNSCVLANNIFFSNNAAKSLGRVVDPQFLFSGNSLHNNTAQDGFINMNYDASSLTYSMNPNLNPDGTLPSNSPVINKGNSSLIPAGLTKDLAGNNRVQGANVDLGAYEYSTLSTDDFSQNQDLVKVYPNPTRDFIRISGLDKETAYQVFSLTGKLVKQGKIKDKDLIDLQSLTSGMYLLKLENGKALKFIKK